MATVGVHPQFLLGRNMRIKTTGIFGRVTMENGHAAKIGGRWHHIDEIEAMGYQGGKVCVTGGSGFVGSWCIKMLLESGYTVHTTVRSADKAAFLLRINGASDRLKIFEGIDLLEPGAFDEALAGCDAVMHTASPFFHGGTEELLVKPAVEGTRNVLTACTKLGVKKVVLTSSIAAIMVNYGTMPKETVYNGDIWSPEDVLRQNENWYDLSKTVQERLAWQLAKEEGCPWKMSVVNPCLIFGPMLPGQSTLNTSQNICVSFMDGSMDKIKDGFLPLVDVRNVAEAHLLALETDNALGQRFLMIDDILHRSVIAEAVRRAVPADLKEKVPTEIDKKDVPPFADLFDNSLARQILGIKFVGLEKMVQATVNNLLENGFRSTQQYVAGK